MRHDPLIEENINTFIEGQFPAFYREHGPVFVAFLRTYYKWMESEGQALHHSRRIPQYRDIDTTVDQFLVHFKEQYLKNIQLGTEANVRQLVKNSLDLYRSRGSEQAVDLLFRLVFGAGATVYYPSSDLFRLSDGKWTVPTYLEVTSPNDLSVFVGYQVRGETSKATAFVERYVRKKTPAKYVDILYISNVKGTFKAGELINRTASPLALADCPVLSGSLSDLTVIDAGSNFKIGDVVDITSTNGYGGKVRVSGIANSVGVVSLNMLNGGYGYSNNAQVLISNIVINMSSVIADPSSPSPDYFTMFEDVYQPTANITYESASGSFSIGQEIFTYTTGVQDGRGVIMELFPSTNTSGLMKVSVRSGNLNKTTIYTPGNAVSANLSVLGGYVDTTAHGNLMGDSATLNIKTTGLTEFFIPGEEIYTSNGSGQFDRVNIDTVTLSNCVGHFFPGDVIRGRVSDATAVVQNISFSIGLINNTRTFFVDPNAPLYGSVSKTMAFINTVSSGTGASITLDRTLVEPEIVALNTDIIGPYASVPLSAANFGFPAVGTETLSTIINTALTTSNTVIGRLSGIATYSRGFGYTAPPMVRAYEPLTYPYRRAGWKVTLPAATALIPGEIITQASSGAKGEVISIDDTTVYLRRMSFNANLTITSGVPSQIVGQTTGEVANISIIEDYQNIGGQLEIGFNGFDAVFTSNVTTAQGGIATVSISDSGFGYMDGEVVFFNSEDGSTAAARAGITTHGTGTGYYKEKGGFLSDSKKLYDGEYYQEFSYDVRSSVTLNQYSEILKKILHVAGTKSFGTFVRHSNADMPIQAVSNIRIGT